MPVTRRDVIVTAALSAAFLAPLAQAQGNWPDKPVRFVVPYAPGGTTDYAARQVAQRLTEQLGKSFFVENRAGASGTIGTTQVVKSPADGSTFLVNDTTYSMLPALFKKLPWDHGNDLIPVTTLATTPVVMVVPESSPYKTLQDLLAFARKNPGKVNYGSGGAGSSTHLAGEVLRDKAGLALVHIPYKGAGEAMLGVMSGQVDVLITASPTAMGPVKGGKVRALAVSGSKRVAALPGVPTFAEAGVKGYDVTNWFGLAAPKGTSPEIVSRLQAAVRKAVNDPALKARLEEQGAVPGGISPTEFSTLIQRENAAWSAVAKAAGVKAD